MKRNLLFFRVLLIGLLLVFVAAIYWLVQLRRPIEDVKEEAQRAVLMHQAEMGELRAYVELHRTYKEDLDFSVAEYWEFRGALAGENSLRESYLRRLMSMTAKERDNEIERIDKTNFTNKNKSELRERVSRLSK